MSWMRACRVLILILACSGVSACAWLFHKPRPDADVPATPRPILLQDRCYNGGYLGTNDPGKVCANASRVVFWDSVHPTTFTHCWIAWFVQSQMAQAGFLGPAPTAEANRWACAAAIP